MGRRKDVVEMMAAWFQSELLCSALTVHKLIGGILAGRIATAAQKSEEMPTIAPAVKRRGRGPNKVKALVRRERPEQPEQPEHPGDPRC